jgi:hypothetical protein
MSVPFCLVPMTMWRSCLCLRPLRRAYHAHKVLLAVRDDVAMGWSTRQGLSQTLRRLARILPSLVALVALVGQWGYDDGAQYCRVYATVNLLNIPRD